MAVVFNDRHEKVLYSKVKKLVGMLSYDKQMINWHEEVIYKEKQRVAEEFLKNKDVKKYVKKTEFLFLFYDLTRRFLEEKDKLSEMGKLNDFLNQKERQELVGNIINFFKKLPYTYFYHYQLPIELPDGVSEIKICDDISITKIIDEKTSGILSGLLLGNTPFQSNVNAVFLRIKSIGYGDLAAKNTIETFKVFLYLSYASGLFYFSSWNKDDKRIFKQGFYTCNKLNGKSRIPHSIPNEVVSFVSGVKLNEKKFEGFVKANPNRPSTLLTRGYENYEDFFSERFLDRCSKFKAIYKDREVKDIQRILAAILWGFDGLANENETMGFIQTCIGLEAILGERNKPEERSLTDKLADRCAYILGESFEEREQYYKSFKELYARRSKLVHGTEAHVSEDDEAYIAKAKDYLLHICWKEIWRNRKV